MAAPQKKKRIVVPPGKKLIFRPWIRDRRGRLRHAAEFGRRVFAILVDA